LLLAALALGALLLGGAYLLGTVNRWREGGPARALYSSTGIAGSAVFTGLGLAAAGWYLGSSWPVLAGGTLAVAGLALAFTGFLAEAGRGASAVAEAAMQVFDVVVALGSSIASFARLAAFGLTHAAIGAIVWQGTSGLWPGNPIGAVAIFLAGTVVALALEGLVVGIQALRLEYYELFSRVFQAEGRPFRPWSPSITAKETLSCPPGPGEASISSTPSS
jgi:V/A-type H+-transporting ATPase subunit I